MSYFGNWVEYDDWCAKCEEKERKIKIYRESIKKYSIGDIVNYSIRSGFGNSGIIYYEKFDEVLECWIYQIDTEGERIISERFIKGIK